MYEAVMFGCVLAGCATHQKELALGSFVDEHVEQVKPLNTRAALVYWDAAVTGEAEKYDLYSELDLKIRKIYSDPNAFARLKSLRESGQIKDPVLSRQLDQLYNAFLSNQIEPDLLEKIVEQSTNIEKNFSTFRATVDGDKITVKSNISTITTTAKVTEKIGPGVIAISYHLGREESGRYASGKKSPGGHDNEPDLANKWWDTYGVHPNHVIPNAVDPVNGQQCWMDTVVKVAKA